MWKYFKQAWESIKKFFGKDDKPEEQIDWIKGHKHHDLAVATTSVSFKTQGITHQSEKNAVGHEYIIAALTGSGFNRVLLCHMSGSGRALRAIVEASDGSDKKLELGSDNLPGVHEWKMTWNGSKISFHLDEKQVGSTGFSGDPNRATIGGNGDSRRNMVGTWSEFKQE